MPENLPTPSTGGWFVEWVTNGKLPGAAKAIAQLVGDTANAGSAWVNIITAKGQQVQQRIRTETSGSQAVMDALAAEAAKLGVSDPAVVEVALRQLGSSAIRKHLNKTAVLKETAAEMNAGDPTGDAPDEMDDDWLNRFENIASEAGSDRMRKLLGKILAGEIRKPGAYSFATLNFINLLDAKVGSAISSLAPYVLQNDMIPLPGRFDFKEIFDDIIMLRQYGLIGENLRRRCTISPDKSMLLRTENHGLIIREIASTGVFLDYIPLTRVGVEIFPLVEAKSTIAHVTETAEAILNGLPCGAIEIGFIHKPKPGTEEFVPVDRKVKAQQ